MSCVEARSLWQLILNMLIIVHQSCQLDCRIVQLPSNLFLCDVYHIFSDLLLTGIEFSKIYFTIDRYEILII